MDEHLCSRQIFGGEKRELKFSLFQIITAPSPYLGLYFPKSLVSSIAIEDEKQINSTRQVLHLARAWSCNSLVGMLKSTNIKGFFYWSRNSSTLCTYHEKLNPTVLKRNTLPADFSLDLLRPFIFLSHVYFNSNKIGSKYLKIVSHQIESMSAIEASQTKIKDHKT